MGRNYYLCRGYISDNWRGKLTKVFGDNVRSLELIDLYTMAYDNLDHLKSNLLELGFINSLNEDLVIARNQTDKKTKEKRLGAIFLKDLIFKDDLELIGVKGDSYKELARDLWKFIIKRQNNKQFMKYIINQYVEKYSESERKRKAPIFESGDISTLEQIIKYANPDERMKSEYELCFTNFFRNEIYKCEIKLRDININGRYSQLEKAFEPIDRSINEKGFHDLLIHVIRYTKMYEPKISLETQEECLEYDTEEYFEDRDFERPLANYAISRPKYDEDGVYIEGEIDPLDLHDEEAIEKDSKALSYKLDQMRFMNRKEDGME